MNQIAKHSGGNSVVPSTDLGPEGRFDWIVEAPRIADQAHAFIGINETRIRVTRVNVFWAQVAAHDPDALWIKSICDRAGIAIGRVGSGTQPPKTTIALAAILKLRSLGDDLLIRALSVLAQAQPKAFNAFRAATINALVKLIGLNADRLDEARLVEKLADMDLDQEIDKARVYCKTLGGNTEAALLVILIRAYNQRLSEDRRLPEKP